MADPSIYAGIDLIGGGTGAIDKINGSVLIDKNMFFTIKNGILYPHWLDDDSGAAEDSPSVISPDLNAGNKRWLLTGLEVDDIITKGPRRDVRAYGADTTKDDNSSEIQATIDSLTSGGVVLISENYNIKSDLTLLDNVTIIMEPKGKLTIPVDATITEAVLYSNGKSNIVLSGITIDASATSGVGGVKFYNTYRCTIKSSKLTKCNIMLHSSNVALNRKIICRDNYLDMDSFNGTAIYVSAVRNVNVLNNTVKNGKEGIGVYNFANNIKIDGNECYDMTQDGIVNIQGHDIQITNNHCYSNGQSGITLHRISSYLDSRKIVISGNICYDNTFDGIDLNGGTYADPMEVVVEGNICYSNTGCGIYVIKAHGLILSNNYCYLNLKQGIFLNGTSRGNLSSNSCSSNASSIGSGYSKAGILLQDTQYTVVIGCISSNQHGAAQDYGLSEVGTAGQATIIGGYYGNNIELALIHIAEDSVLIGVEAIPRTIRTLDNTGTPTVLTYYKSETFLTGGTTTITDFDNGVEDQTITIIAEHTLTITDDTNIFLNSSGNFTMTPTDTLTLLQKADGKWYERARSLAGTNETVTTGSPALTLAGITKLDSSGGAITGTLADGEVIGGEKTIIMIDATTSSTISVANHITEDPEVFTFAQAGDTLILRWNGTDWMTIFNNGVAV